MVKKIRPDAEINYSFGNDGRDSYFYVEYSCPTCHRTIKEDDIACTSCGEFFDWSKKAKIVVRREVNWE